MKQTNLFDPPLAHRDDPITSYEAADKIIEKLNDQEEWVWSHIWTCRGQPNGVTAKDVAKLFNMNYFIIQRRLSGLARKGKIEFLTVTGKWVKMLDENNRPATRNGCRIIRAV